MKLRWFMYSFIDYANIRNRWIQVYIQISTQKRHFVHFTETFSAEMSCCSGKNNSRALSKSLCNKIYKWEAPLPSPSSWLSSLMLLPVLQQTNFHWSRWHHFFAKSLPYYSTKTRMENGDYPIIMISWNASRQKRWSSVNWGPRKLWAIALQMDDWTRLKWLFLPKKRKTSHIEHDLC